MTESGQKPRMLARDLLPTLFRRAYPVVMPLAPNFFTADMVRDMPDDGNRYEVVWGELLVSPAPVPRHQRLVGRLHVALVVFAERYQLGEVLMSPADISWSDDTLVQPDLFVIDPSESGSDDWRSVKTLRLVVEVLSPSTARHDRFAKRKLYQAQGIKTVWLVDSERRLIEVWTPDTPFPTVETESVDWHPSGAPVPLTIALADLFA